MKRLAAIPYVALCLCALAASAYCALEVRTVRSETADLAALPVQYLTLSQTVESRANEADTLQRKVTALSSNVEPLLGERIVDLPEDSHTFFLTVFTSANYRDNPAERNLLASLESQPEWQSLKAQTAYHHYVPGNAMYEKYAAAVGNQLPAVMLQDSTGKVVYKVSGEALSAAEDQYGWFPGQRVIKGIRAVLKKLINGCKPKPKPTPTPAPGPVTPSPVTPVSPPTIPDIGPQIDETPFDEPKDAAIPLAVGLGTCSLIGGVGIAWRKQHSGY